MPLMLDLSPTMEARLQTEAQRRDLSVSDFVKMLLTQLEEHQDPASTNTPPVQEAVAYERLIHMKEAQIQHRELVVEVITHKNNLQAEVARTERLIAELECKATSALKERNRDLARKLYLEGRMHTSLLHSLQAYHETAVELSDQVKEALLRGEERVRLHVAQQLARQTRRRHFHVLERVDAFGEQFPDLALCLRDMQTWDQRFEEWTTSQTISEPSVQQP